MCRKTVVINYHHIKIKLILSFKTNDTHQYFFKKRSTNNGAKIANMRCANLTDIKFHCGTQFDESVEEHSFGDISPEKWHNLCHQLQNSKTNTLNRY